MEQETNVFRTPEEEVFDRERLDRADRRLAERSGSFDKEVLGRVTSALQRLIAGAA